MLDRSARIDGQQSYAEQECAVIEQESSELAGISYVGSNIDQKLEQHRLRSSCYVGSNLDQRRIADLLTDFKNILFICVLSRISNMNIGLIVLMPVITIDSCFSVINVFINFCSLYYS